MDPLSARGLRPGDGGQGRSAAGEPASTTPDPAKPNQTKPNQRHLVQPYVLCPQYPGVLSIPAPQYGRLLHDQDCDSMEVLLSLQDQDLKEMGMPRPPPQLPKGRPG